MRLKYIVGLALMTSTTAYAEIATKPQMTSLGKSYLAPTELPDSVALLPPPPAAGSKALARDEAAQKAAVAQRGSARWKVATDDALLFGPTATSALSCAAGFEISPSATPKIDAILRKAAPDLALASYAAKRKYQRARPFMVNNQPNCTPELDAVLRKDGSYPSGHSAIGYGWGLILTDIVPSHTKKLIARGKAFGDSRRICNVHWLSDVEAGRVVATETVKTLRAHKSYIADIEAAKAELKTARNTPPIRDCAAEAAALKGTK